MFSFTHTKNTAQTKPKTNPGYVRYVNKIGNDPFVDWILILSVSLLIAFILIGVGAYIYVDTQSQLSGSGTVSPTSIANTHFDVQNLKKIITTFDARATERVSLGKGYVGPSDPSLP